MRIIVAFAFIVLDFVTGFLGAIKEKKINSSILRQGLFHKISFILCIVLAILCDYAQNFIDLSFNVPVTMAVCVYVIVTEISSIIENLSILNPDIVPEKLKQLFIKVKGE